MVGEVGAGVSRAGADFFYVPGDPVGAGFREGKGEECAVGGEGKASEGDGAVGREGVGIEQEVGLAVWAVLPEKDSLILEAGVVGVDEAVVTDGGGREALKVGEGEKALAEGLAAGNGVEDRAGEGVLRADPGFDFGAVDVFHPAVGIRDGGVEVGVDVVGAARGWVHEWVGCSWRGKDGASFRSVNGEMRRFLGCASE